MIGQIRGQLLYVRDDQALLEVGGVGYEVTVSPILAERLKGLGAGADVTLVTHHYLQSDPSKSVPMLIGFESEAQREFFLELITVARLGAKSAVRALTMPISHIARAIEMGDAKRLQALPGIGRQKAKDIIAKLQGKVGRYVGVEEEEAPEAPRPLELEVEDDALDILLQLGYTQADALKLIADATMGDGEYESADQLIQEIFRRQKA
ncbi:MAG: Holliday junction branch migration protein RuvA [Armatimonadota bacterium]